MGNRAASLISVRRMGFLSTIGVLDLRTWGSWKPNNRTKNTAAYVLEWLAGRNQAKDIRGCVESLVRDIITVVRGL